MQRISDSRTLLLLVAVTFASACGDSTGPAQPGVEFVSASVNAGGDTLTANLTNRAGKLDYRVNLTMRYPDGSSIRIQGFGYVANAGATWTQKVPLIFQPAGSRITGADVEVQDEWSGPWRVTGEWP